MLISVLSRDQFLFLRGLNERIYRELYMACSGFTLGKLKSLNGTIDGGLLQDKHWILLTSTFLLHTGQLSIGYKINVYWNDSLVGKRMALVQIPP